MAEFNNISTISTLESQGQTAFSVFDFNSISPSQTTESISGKKQTKTVQSQRFSFTAQFVPLTAQEYKPILAFVTKQRGQAGQFTISIPVLHEGTITSGTATGTIGSTSLTVSGTGTLKAGDIIGFNDTANNHSKAYMVTDDVTISGSGTVTIVPGLQKAVSSQSFATGNSVELLVRLTNDTQAYRTSADGFYRYEMDFEEVI